MAACCSVSDTHLLRVAYSCETWAFTHLLANEAFKSQFHNQSWTCNVMVFKRIVCPVLSCTIIYRAKSVVRVSKSCTYLIIKQKIRARDVHLHKLRSFTFSENRRVDSQVFIIAVDVEPHILVSCLVCCTPMLLIALNFFYLLLFFFFL